MTWPSTLTALTNPQATDHLNSPSHSSIHTAANNAITQIETFIGTASSAVGTLTYDIRSPLSDGGGHVQTTVKGGTGQVTYTKGDTLIASSPSVLTKLAIGADGLALVADTTTATGVKWGSGNTKPTVRVYGTSSSVITWTKPVVLSYIRYRIVGGGGGGGDTSGATSAGAGGGGGAYTEGVLSASVLGSTIKLNAAAGGTAGSAGTGGTGGFSYFGGYFGSVVGGAGGVGTNNSDGASGGAAPTGGDVNLSGQQGGASHGAAGDLLAGHGGVAGFGAGTYGLGGNGNRGAAAASAGQPGVVIIEEY